MKRATERPQGSAAVGATYDSMDAMLLAGQNLQGLVDALPDVRLQAKAIVELFGLEGARQVGAWHRAAGEAGTAWARAGKVTRDQAHLDAANVFGFLAIADPPAPIMLSALRLLDPRATAWGGVGNLLATGESPPSPAMRDLASRIWEHSLDLAREIDSLVRGKEPR